MSQLGSKEIYSYVAPWPVYGMNWSCKKDKLRLGFGSFLENYQNKVYIIGKLLFTIIKHVFLLKY